MSNDNSILGAVKSLGSDLSDIFHNEIATAKSELQDSIAKVGKGAGLFGGAGVVALFAAEFLLLTILFALIAVGLTPWASALIIGGALLIVAAVLGMMGKKNVSEAAAAPAHVAGQVREDAETIKEDVRRVVRR